MKTKRRLTVITAFRITPEILNLIDNYRKPKEWTRSHVIALALDEFFKKDDRFGMFLER